MGEVDKVQRRADVDDLPDVGIVEVGAEHRGRYDSRLAGVGESTFDNIGLFVGRIRTGCKGVVAEVLRDNDDIVAGPAIEDNLIVVAAET